jgi:hypothetical protein
MCGWPSRCSMAGRNSSRGGTQPDHRPRRPIPSPPVGRPAAEPTYAEAFTAVVAGPPPGCDDQWDKPSQTRSTAVNSPPAMLTRSGPIA